MLFSKDINLITQVNEYYSTSTDELLHTEEFIIHAPALAVIIITLIVAFFLDRILIEYLIRLRNK